MFLRQLQRVLFFKYHYKKIKEEPYSELLKLHYLYDIGNNFPKLLFLGDSVVERIARNEDDNKTLGSLLKNQLKNKIQTEYISHSAYNSEIFLYMIMSLIKMRNMPQYIIMPVNMRSFSPQWHFNPVWKLDKEKEVFLKYIKNTDKRILKIRKSAVCEQSYLDFDSTKVHFPYSKCKTIGEFRKIINSKTQNKKEFIFRKKHLFIFHYMYDLEINHPKVIFFREIINLTNMLGIKLFLYVTPINFEAGNKYVGKTFKMKLEENVKTLKNALGNGIGNFNFSDYSALLGPEYFFNIDESTEHLNESGRRKLSDELAQKILSDI